jgi:exonuclease VII small subunit
MAHVKTYRKLEDELSVILERVENASYDELDGLLKDYNAGIEIVGQLEKKLEAAKNTIKKATKSA